jgi:hypothetical protein
MTESTEGTGERLPYVAARSFAILISRTPRGSFTQPAKESAPNQGASILSGLPENIRYAGLRLRLVLAEVSPLGALRRVGAYSAPNAQW